MISLAIIGTMIVIACLFQYFVDHNNIGWSKELEEIVQKRKLRDEAKRKLEENKWK